MKVHLASAGVPREQSCIPAFEGLAAESRSGHVLTDDPSDADIVLFTEAHLLGDDWALRGIRSAPAFTEARDRVVVYDESDRPWCAFPGLYVSMPAGSARPAFQQAWPYYSVEDPRTRLDDGESRELVPDLLFSFVGSPTHPCREPIFQLEADRGHVERVENFTFYDSGSPSFEPRRRHFAELVLRSKFVLCPRGRGTSSIRCYEAMAAGRVPVIIADDWIPPPTLPWSTVALRHREGDAIGLLKVLEDHEATADEMGRSARAAYEEHLSPGVTFDRMVEGSDRLLRTDPWRSFPRLGYPDRSTARRAMGALKRRLR